MTIIIWDNGEEFLEDPIWFVKTDHPTHVVKQILNAAAAHGPRRGGVIATVDESAMDWAQERASTFAEWFTCHGNELVDWRTRTVEPVLFDLPESTIRNLAERLYPSNAEIVLERLSGESAKDEAGGGVINWSEIDEGIRPALRCLHAAGLETTGSCQGGGGHPKPGGWIALAMISTLDEVAHRTAVALIGGGFEGFSVLRRVNYQRSTEPWASYPGQVEVEFWAASPMPRESAEDESGGGDAKNG